MLDLDHDHVANTVLSVSACSPNASIVAFVAVEDVVLLVDELLELDELPEPLDPDELPEPLLLTVTVSVIFKTCPT